MSDKCQVEVWSRDVWSSHGRVCGRAVKGEGLCGIHLRVKRESEAKDRQRAERIASGEVVVERLSRHGVKASVGYDGTVYVGGANVLADELDAKYPA